jgi:VIT1/CCC1 family predicted Fe2+/Mn2+ transporter
MLGRRYATAAVFGAFDGLIMIVGIMLPLLGDPHALVMASVGGAVSEGAGMAVGDYLSGPEGGLREALVMGAATGLAAVVPSAPFMVGSGGWAVGSSAALMMAVASAITAARHLILGKPLKTAAVETFGLLLAVAALVGACASAVDG